MAGTLLTGSWYSFALAEVEPPPDRAERVARLVWQACGAVLPD